MTINRNIFTGITSAILTLIVWFTCFSYGFAQQCGEDQLARLSPAIVGGGVAAAPPSEDTPNVWGARLDDNAANKTIDAYVGSDGTAYDSNTSVWHSTDAEEGTGSFLFTSNIDTVLSPTVSATNFDDGNFTIQFSFKATTAFTPGAYERFFAFVDAADYSQDVLFYVQSDTQVTYYANGDWDNLAVNDLTTGAWQVIRVVVDRSQTKKIIVYQGSSEATLAEVSSSTAIGDEALNSTMYIDFGGDASTGKSIYSVGGRIDNLKVWDTAVTP